MGLKDLLKELLNGHHGYEHRDQRGHHSDHHRGHSQHKDHSNPDPYPRVNFKTCSNCGTQNIAEAQFCQECGQSFSPRVPIPQSQAKPTVCVKCGNAIDHRSRFCPNCGAQQV